MTPEALHGQVEAAVMAEVERVGPDALNKAGIYNRFKGQGASRATLYRWIDAPLKSGKAGMHLTHQIRQAAAARASAVADPAADAAIEASEIILVPSIGDIAGYGGTVAFVAKVQAILANAELVIAHAKGEDGKPRNARLLVSANENLRRAMETALKLHHAMREISAVDRFLAAIVDSLRQESPELAERVVRRLNQLAAEWGAL